MNTYAEIMKYTIKPLIVAAAAWRRRIMCMSVLLMMTSCQDPGQAQQQSHEQTHEQAQQQSQETYLELAHTRQGLKEQIIEHTGYTASYNPDLLIPNWVAWELTRDEANGTLTRSTQFTPDPTVQGNTALTYDYSRSGYDRGHMAPAGDMKWDNQAMSECFYLSNICPQNHDMNSGQWEKLERRCRGWAKQYGKVWICCGPIMGKSRATIGEHHVAVPESFFKVVMVERKGEYNAIGFILPNDACEGEFWDYAVTVNEVEEITGHDFFYNLPDDIEEEIEERVDVAKIKN